MIYRHQMTALDFVVQRESDRPPEQLTFWRERRVSGETEYADLNVGAFNSSIDCVADFFIS